MASRIPVLLSESPYEVIVGNGILPRTGEFISQLLPAGKCAVVTDSTVGPLYAEVVRRSLEQAGYRPSIITVAAGESSKSLKVVEQVCDQMIEAGLDRKSFVVALGGGVVGDLAAFCASIFYRGVPCVQIPTSILAQVDSAVGGKTGVNSSLGKNLIGTFHQPILVIADPALTKTLGRREFNEGFAEIIKHAAIRDAQMFDLLANVGSEELSSLIAQNVKIKARIVAEDEFEQHGLRALLNFGHTIGHAIENVAGYGKYLHGEAISLGLMAALSLSVEKAGLSEDDARKVVGALKNFQLPTKLPEEIRWEDLLVGMKKDKKFEAGAIRYVLIPRLGEAFVSKDVSEQDLAQTVERIRRPLFQS